MSARVRQLAYLGFEVKDLDAWERFGTGVLGAGVGARFDGGGFSLRLDERAHRVFVAEGPADDMMAVGWEVDDAAALDAIVARIEPLGAEPHEAPADLRELRGVECLVLARDPAGTPIELSCGPAMADEPFVSELVRSGFVTGEQGMGHLVVRAPGRDASLKFYTEGLGLRLSDQIKTKTWGFDIDIHFLHANPRHHSLALGGPQRKNVHHVLFEVGSLDDVGRGLDRTMRAGLPIMQTLGRHPNDHMLSFYAKTPSGFQFEYGWGGLKVDEEAWEVGFYDKISEWGHHPPALVSGHLKPPE